MAKTFTLLDDFNDNSRDTALWNSFGTGIAEANGQLEVTLAAGSTSYHGYTSAASYDLTASDVRIRVVSAGNQALASLEVYPLLLQINSNNNINFLISGNFLRAYKKVAGVSTQLASTAYVADTHRFLRIREASGTTYWQYSADGITWTNLTSQANPITMTSLQVAIEAGTYASEASATSAKFDDFNTYYTTTGYKFPTNAYTETTVDVSSTAWQDPRNILADDSSRSRGFTYVGGTPILRELRLVIDGVIQSTSIESSDTITGSDMPFGGASQLWGASSIPVETAEATHFGVAVAVGKSTPTTETNYLIAETFGFDIPTSATISGLKTNLSLENNNLGGGVFAIDMNAIELQAYFQWSPSISGGGQASGVVWTARLNFKQKDKQMRHRVYSKDGTFIGEWQDASEPTFKQQVNTLVSTMELELARTDLVGGRSTEDLTTEADEVITSEADETLLADTAAASGIGAGTDLDTNLDYQLTAVYGEFVELLAEDGTPITLENDEIITVEEGAPTGRSMFTGWITDTEADWGTSETVKASLVSHSHELNNIPFETPDTKAVTFATESSEFGISGAGPSDNNEVGQSFTMVGSVDVSRITLQAKRWGGETIDSFPKVTLTLRLATPDAPGAVVATAEAYVTSRDWADLNFVFPDYVALTNATVYSFELEVDQQKTGGAVTYPVTFRTGSGYTGGQAYKIVGGGAWTADSSFDLLFSVWQAGGNTTVTLNSQDPSAMLRQVADFAASRGARVVYDESTISDTGTTVSYSFKGMTCAEAIEQILKLCPGDWYYWYDIGTNELHLHDRPSTESKYLTLKKNVPTLKIKKSIRNIVNDVLFTGGGNPALFIRTQDTASQNTYRRGLKKISDSRVTVSATATTINTGEITRYKDPIYYGSGSVIGIVSYDPAEIGGNVFIEDYTLGELLGLSGFGNSEYDDLSLQLMGYTYSPDSLSIEVGNLLPRVSKRIEDIKRNLNNVEQQYQPTAPS